MTKIGDSGKGIREPEKRIIPVIPMSSPLYLHPSDTPNMSRTTTKFNGENYDLWAATVKNGLDAKNKLGFIEGKVEKPQGDEGEDNIALVALRQCNAMIRGWLRSSIDDKLHPSITFSGNVKEIWDELRERYAAGNTPRVHQLKGELNDCKQGRESVVDYYTCLKIIWDELANYSRVPPCTCGAATELTKEREEEKVHQFLMGLDSKLYERHVNMMKEKDERNEMAMSVTIHGFGRGKAVNGSQGGVDEEEIRQCTHCCKLYHTEDTCYGKHGYEAVRARGRGRGRRGMTGGRGNASRGGRNGGRGQHTTYQASAVGATGGVKETGTQASNPFSSEEIERLRLILAASPNKGDKLTGMNAAINIEWLIDSGCSHHITGRRECLSHIRTMSTSIVGLPDGRKVEACDHGEVVIDKNFVLKDVLYVPTLQCDLISVEQLIRENNCVVTFHPDFCVIQDRAMKTEIGRGDARDGVCYYKGEKIHMASKSNDDGIGDPRVVEMTHDDRASEKVDITVDVDENVAAENIAVEENAAVECLTNDEATRDIVGDEVSDTHAEPLGRGARQRYAPYWCKDYSYKSSRVINPSSCVNHFVHSKSEKPEVVKK
ncbi:hypothetical protein BVRB_2g038990 [Beta vulgaris subsp. vulgaris]|nr:hypothetical protein BVRB_2g038990 [Beta vulgaris subsp. vulgaris]